MNYEFNRKVFADTVRVDPVLFNGRMTNSQWKGTEALLDYIDQLKWHPTSEENQYFFKWNAYNFATAFHETARTMQPVKEFGSESYLRSKRYYPYVGRGFVQLTWKENYKRSDNELNTNNLISQETLNKLPNKVVNQTANMGQAMNLEIACANLMVGNWKGWWTTRKLNHYLTNTKTDYHNARRIVNGTDRAAQIAKQAKAFEKAFRKSWMRTDSPTLPETPTPPGMPEFTPEEKARYQEILGHIFKGLVVLITALIPALKKGKK